VDSFAEEDELQKIEKLYWDICWNFFSAALLCRALCRGLRLICKLWQPRKKPRERNRATILIKPSNTHKQTHLPGESNACGRIMLPYIDITNLDVCDSFVGVFDI